MAIRKISDRITPSIDNLQRNLPRAVAQTYKFFVSVTPRDSGNARKKTKLKGNVIEARYAYAKRLDEGYSKKAPQGMVKPTVKFLERLLRRIIRK